MDTPHVKAPSRSNTRPADEATPAFRTKTVATRLTPEELAEVEAAAEGAKKPLAEWLRDTALREARKRPADATELLLAEVWALRYALLNFFHAGAQAASEGRQLLPDSVLKIRDQADVQKQSKARYLLEEVRAHKGEKGNQNP
jgi:hypothetical protein